MLYHGTTVGGLSIIKANAKSHTSGKAVAYFTEDKCYALACCRSRNENFVTMGLREDGKQHYYERFPNQLRILYGGRRGYIYLIEKADGLINTSGHTWESEADMPVHQYVPIDDVYAEILKEEQAGHIVIHRYLEIDPIEQKQHANYIKEHIDDQGSEMRQFYLTYFSSLWD